MMKYFMKKIAITAIVCVGSLAPYSVYGSNNEEDKLKDGESLRFNTTQAHTPLLAQQPRDLVQLRMLEDEAPQLVRMLPQGFGGGGWPPRPDPRLFEAPDILSWFSQLDIDDFEPKDTAYNRLLVDFASDKLDNILEDANWLFNPSKKCKTCFQDNCFSMQLDESLGFKSIEDNQSFLDDKNDSDVVQFKRSQFEKLKILLLHPNDLNMGQNIALFKKLSGYYPCKVSRLKQANHSDENIPYVEHSQQIFSIIPRDVLCLIFSYLPAEDLRSVFQVNKQFAATAGLYLRTIRDRIIKEYHNPRKLNLLPLGVRVPQPSSVIKTWLSELPSEVESVLRSRLSQIVAMPTLTAFALPHELHLFEKDPSAPDMEDSQPEDKE